MKSLDYRLQSWRIDKAAAFIPAGSRVLDIGASDGVLFRHLGAKIAGGVGIDPDAEPSDDGRVRLIRGFFPQDLDGETSFDAVTALAFFEHVPDEEQAAVARACFDVLRPGGRCILTIPAPAVDRILDVLIKIKVIDGMHEEEHHAYEPEQTGSIFGSAGFGFVARKRFQLGLNNLFVFERPGLDLQADFA